MKTLTFRQLRVFTEVARHLNFARAAEALHLTPPAVTMQVRELERSVDLPLFERRGRKVALTMAGEYFLVYARRLLSTVKEAEDAMARLRKLEVGTLSIGLVSTAKYFAPHLLARFQKEHPGVDVRLSVTQNREQLLQLMEAAEIDLAIMGRPPSEFASLAEAFAPHPLVFVCAPGHALLSEGAVPLRALQPYPLLVREPASGIRHAMESFFRELRFEPRSRIEMSSNETIKQAVMADMGVALVSLHTVGLELRNALLRIVPLQGTPLMRAWHVVHLPSRVLSPAAEALRYFIVEHGRSWLAEHDATLLPERAWA